MSSRSIDSAAAAAGSPSGAPGAGPLTPGILHASTAATLQQPTVAHAPQLGTPERADGDPAIQATAPCYSPAGSAIAVGGGAPALSPGDTVWIPSATAGFTTAVIVAVDCVHQRLLVRPHPAGTEEFLTAYNALFTAGLGQPAALPPETHQERQGKAGEQQHYERRDEHQQSQENCQQPLKLVRRKLGSDLKLAAASGVDAVDGAEGRVPATLQEEDQAAAFSDCETSEIYVRFTDAWAYRPLPPPPAAVPQDAAALDSLSAASVLQLLHHRFLRKQIYTFAAHVLLAVNPCRTLPGLYDYDVVEVYRYWKGRQSAASAAAFLGPRVAHYLGLNGTCSSNAATADGMCTKRSLNSDSEDDSVTTSNSVKHSSCSTLYDFSGSNSRKRRCSRVQTGSGSSSTDGSSARSNNNNSTAASGSSFPPAHPFAVAQDAHRRLRGEGQNQTIIVNGESGAGKTETSKILMLYLTEVGSLSPSSSSCSRSTRIDQQKGGRSSTNCDSGGRSLAGEQEQQQQPLTLARQAEDGRDDGQSRQAQRRAAAAALLHAAASKRAECSTFSPANSSPPPGFPAASESFGSAVTGSPHAGASASASTPGTSVRSAADAPFARGNACDVGTERSAAATHSGEPAAGELQQRILSCNPVLEAFCNAKTRRNSNSSRVGRLTLLHYDRAGLLHGASIRTYLLESTRVCSHPLWERNFHVFYQLLRGCSKEDLESRRLQRCCSAYQLLTPTPAAAASRQRNEYRLPTRRLIVSAAPPAATTLSTPRSSAATAPEPPPPSHEEIDRDTDSYRLLVEALSKTGFSAAERKELFDAIAGLLHLSNVSFKELPALEAGATHALVIRQRSVAPAPTGGDTRRSSSGDGAAASVTDYPPAIECAAELLRLPLRQLEEVLMWETLTMRHETLRKQRRAEQAAAARDALIKCAYTRIVRLILTKLNESVVARQQPSHQQLDKRQQLDQLPRIGVRHPNSSSDSDACSTSGISSDVTRVRPTSQTEMMEDDTHVESNRHSRGSPSRGSADEGVAAALWGTGLSIGILDIYGFECLDGGANGFEQLCINYANERQQQVFLQRAISEELRLYRCEGLLGVLSSLQPALLSSESSTDDFAAAAAAPLSPCSSPLSSAPRHSATYYSNSSRSSRGSNTSAICSSSSSAERDDRGAAWLLQRQRLQCEQQTEELLSYLTHGLFKRLDDNSRLRARGQQQRLDVHFWRDFFAFCRQREQHRLPTAPSSRNRTSTGSSSSNHRVAAAARQQQKPQPPILFRLLRSGGDNSHITSANVIKSEDSRSPPILQRSPDSLLQQQQQQQGKVQQLLAAGEVRPLHADAAVAASTLQQGAFVVKHFAGLVEYRVDGWLARNNDKAEAEIESLLGLSKLRALQATESSPADAAAGDGDSGARGLAAGWLLNARGRSSSPSAAAAAATGGNTAGGSSTRHFASVSQQFVADLRHLMGELQSSDVHLHFIRCFVSNRAMRPLQLDRALLLRQLQQSGTVALIHVLHKGFPHRVPLSPVAAVFKGKLHGCIAAAVAQLQEEQQQSRNGEGGEASAAVADQLRRLQALHVDHIPDGRLVGVALGLLPNCPRGAVSCGISLLFFKASAYLAATALLRSPEALFSRSDMLLLLQRELTRLRWRVAVAVTVHVRRRLRWLLRRVRLLRVIKQRFIVCAVRALLLRRYILRPLLLRVQKRAAAAAGLKLLQRLLIGRGFHAWVLAYRRATAAEGAAQSLAARVAAAASGNKAEQAATFPAAHLQQNRQVHSSGAALLRRRSKDDGKARRAAVASATVKEESKQHAEREELTPQQLRYPATHGTTCKKRGSTAAEPGYAAQFHAKKTLRSSSVLQETRKGAVCCWWRAALFSVSTHSTHSRCTSQPYPTHSAPTTSAEAVSAAPTAAPALAPLRREFNETLLLFTGKQLYVVHLRIIQRLEQHSDFTTLGLYSAAAGAARRHQQQHVLVRCYALSFASDRAKTRCRTQRSLCSEKTAWQTLDRHRERQRQQPAYSSHQQQQLEKEQSQQQQPENQRPQQQHHRGSQSALQEGQWRNTEATTVQAASAAADPPGNEVEFIRAPTLACIAQHARHPKLFVGCDRQARIFLLPLHLPPYSQSPSDEEDSLHVLSSASGVNNASSKTASGEAAPEAAAFVHSAAQKQNLVQQRLQQASTQEQQQQEARQRSFSQQQSLRSGCSNAKSSSINSRMAQDVMHIREQQMTEEEEEEEFLTMCNCHSTRQQQTRKEPQLPVCAAGTNVPGDTVASREAAPFQEEAAANGTAAACDNVETAAAVSACRTDARTDSAEQLSSSDFRSAAFGHTVRCCPNMSRGAVPVAADGGASGTRTSVPKNSRSFHKLGCPHADGGSAQDSASTSNRNSADKCNRNDGVHHDNHSSSSGGTSSSNSGQTSSSSSINRYSVDQLPTLKEAGDAGTSPSRSASSVYVDSEAANSSVCSLSSAMKKKTLKSLGGGQPSTWLPALVPAVQDLPVCCRPPLATTAAAASSSSSSAAGSNPYLALFRRAAPLPASASANDAPPSVAAVQTRQRERRQEQQNELWLHVDPWLEVQQRVGTSSSLLLPRSCCFPHSVGPAAWVPATLLERAEQRHEQAVLQHHHRQQQQLQQKERESQRSPLLLHEQREKQQQQEQELQLRQQQQQLQQRHVTVRPVRIRFASSYSTQHVLVLAYVSAASSSSRTDRVGKHGAGCRTNNTRGALQRPHNAIAVVAGLWAVVLVDLLRQRALDWKEVFAAESDVFRSARIHRRQLPLLFPHAALAFHCRSSSSAASSNSNGNAVDGELSSYPNATNGSGSSSSSYNGGSGNTSSNREISKCRTSSNSRSNNSNACAVSPSQIVSTGLLEKFGEGMWIVAGPGLLGLLQVRLRQGGGSNSCKGGGCSRKRSSGATDRTFTNRPGDGTPSVTHSGHTDEPEGEIEILWNQARVQQFSHRGGGGSPAGASLAVRSSFDVASAWFTGCTYTATPLAALQDIGPTHPLVTWGELAPESKAAQLLQQHFHRLLMLTSAAGDLLLLRWLPQKRRLRVLRRLPPVQQQRQTESAALWRRFIRVQYADAFEEDEEAAAAEHLLSNQHGICCNRSSCCGSTTCAPSSTFRAVESAVLRLSEVHPHARKQHQQQRRSSSKMKGITLQAKSTAGRLHHDALQEEKVSARRWLDNIGALVACTKENSELRDAATPAAGVSASVVAGTSATEVSGDTASVGRGTSAASTKKILQILRLELPPLMKKKHSHARSGTVFAGSSTEIDGFSTSAESSSSGDTIPRRSSEEGSEGSSPEPLHYKSSISSLGHSTYSNSSVNSSHANSTREPKRGEQENKSVHASTCLFGSRSKLCRSNSQLQEAEPLPQQPDSRQQQQQPRRKPLEQQKQHLFHLGADGPPGSVHTKKAPVTPKCTSGASSYLHPEGQAGPATALFANCRKYAENHVE